MAWKKGKVLGEQSRWEICKYLFRIGDYSGAIGVWFWKKWN